MLELKVCYFLVLLKYICHYCIYQLEMHTNTINQIWLTHHLDNLESFHFFSNKTFFCFSLTSTLSVEATPKMKLQGCNRPTTSLASREEAAAGDDGDDSLKVRRDGRTSRATRGATQTLTTRS
jgi:hypothetical protein